MEDKLYWATGKPGCKADLAGLVCDKYGDETCINELRGTNHEGQTWKERQAFLDGMAATLKAMNEADAEES